MLTVYAFAEYYPNPFKPYLDTQFGQTLADGHDLGIFAFGTWGNPGHRTITEYQLDRRTRYLPGSPRQIARFGFRALRRAPHHHQRIARACREGWGSPRRRLVGATQAALLPGREPDLCLMHDLGTAVRLTSLRQIYPSCRIALYYHGPEVAPGVIPDARTAHFGFNLPDIVFTNTAYSRGDAIARGCPADRIRILPVGFDLREFGFCPRTSAAGEPLRLVTVGRLAPEKGIAHALAAVKRLVDGGTPVLCTVIGNGTERSNLERQVALLGLRDQVRFAGTLPHHTVVDMLRDADAIVLPSIQGSPGVENQACVLQEAMLVGTMMIASDIGGVAESVPPDMREFLVTPGDEIGLAGAIQRLTAMPLDQRAARARANRAYCERHYDVRRINRALLAMAMDSRPAERVA